MKDAPNTQKRRRVLAVDLEPTPYKFDLWNAFEKHIHLEVNVLFSSSKNWAPDGGHNYLELPRANFQFCVLKGKGFISSVSSILVFVKKRATWKPDIVIISGYFGILPLCSILICSCVGQNYAIHSDLFNNKPARSFSENVKYVIRNLIRRLIFKAATAILNCGKRGCESAIEAGCNPVKALDFPYVVDVDRLQTDQPNEIPQGCREDIASGLTILFLSARMIERKGHEVFFQAVAMFSGSTNWLAWIEGDGPFLEKYKREALRLGIADRCRFLGFCQMSLHSWLIRNSDIVVVPSLHDPWGIVVDEGMQLGKAVVTTYETGAGVDRITSGINGVLLTAGNVEELSINLRMLITDEKKRSNLGNAAKVTASSYRPSSNANLIYRLLLSER